MSSIQDKIDIFRSNCYEMAKDEANEFTQEQISFIP